MDLSTTYMGLSLKNPLVASAGPLTAEIGTIRQLEDAGAGAVVLHSLFEEQLSHEAEELEHHLTHGAESFAEAVTYFPQAGAYKLGPDEYLEHVAKAKAAVGIPVIGSLNGASVGGWTEYARRIEEAGADALELNVYFVATDPSLTSSQVEDRYVDILKAVKKAVRVPVAIKLGPFFSAMASMAQRLDQAGADALVLFNRFYQPDIDLDQLEVVPNVVLSGPYEMRLPLRWMAILYGRVKASLAAARGIASAHDVLKMLMAGADVTQMLSVLLRKGPGEVSGILEGMKAWMEEHEYESVQQMKGSMSQKSCAEPAAFERANYMKTLQSYV
ncbi:MAG TPA: dihydroorotate dehydrogenase-like protein [Phycisphaerae bacterium]|nr:dihydroorotate dehydrogenase-like protein [Phycisphaerae bacterium]